MALDVQLRTRGEYNNGAIVPRNEGETPALFINERARVGVHYSQQHLELRLAAQHTGVWGQDNIKERNGRLAMHEAWAKLYFSQNIFAQLGRQQLSYDDERLLGTSDWDVAGNWHDALRFGYHNGSTKAHLILAVNQNSENNRTGYYAEAMPYKAMQTLWLHHDFERQPVGVSLLAMNLGREAGTNTNGKTKLMQTLGTHLTFTPQGLDLAASFYFQTGRTTADKDVSAFMGSLSGSYALSADCRVRGGYDYLSGNDGRNINEHAFDPLFGTHHKFYGAMDYFTGRSEYGLQDLHIGLSATLQQLPRLRELLLPMDISLDYHYLLTAEAPQKLSKSLGHELDLHLSCHPMKDVTLSAGYSFFLGTATMDALKGGAHRSWQDWAWVSLSVAPRLK